MKRLYLVIGLVLASTSALAIPYDINISVTYTKGASDFAGTEQNTVPAAVANCLSVTNAAYAAQGINIRLIPIADSAPAKSSPPDTATMERQYAFAQNSYAAWQSKYYAQAAIAVHVSEPGPFQEGRIAATLPTTTQTAAASIPYRALCSQLELSISSIIGSQGYSKRVRTYATDTPGGNAICFHTRDAKPTDPNELVPTLDRWEVNGYQKTGSATAAIACAAWPDKDFFGQGYTTTLTAGPVCNLFNRYGVSNGGTPMTHYLPTSGTTMMCTDSLQNTFANPALMSSTDPSYPLGDSSHNSVAAMNARAFALTTFYRGNSTYYDRVKGSIITQILRLMKLTD